MNTTATHPRLATSPAPTVCPLIDEYDAVMADLIGIVRLSIDGQPGVGERARQVLCDGDESLSGRLAHLRQHLLNLSLSETPTVIVKKRIRG